MKGPLLVVLVAAAASTASAEPIPLQGNVFSGRTGFHFTRVPGGYTAAAADTHVLYMNPCKPSGCTVHAGNTDNTSDTSDIANSTITLSAWNQSQQVWDDTMACMRETFSRFNVTVTDVDPGTAPHMEVMVAGVATQLLGSQGNGVGGIADFPCNQVGQCDSFMPNALVFAFANDPYYANDPLEICSTAAQEIAHTWALDHVVDASDPMTYNPYSGMREYHDGEKCGSDCQGGQSPFGLTCSGTGGQATHTCTGTGTATQDEVSTMFTLFGSSKPDTMPPSVTITAPATGASVQPGFTITANITDDVDVVSGEAKLDGTSLGKVGAPYSWKTPSTLAPGNHHIEVIGVDGAGNMTSATVDVGYGQACKATSDCMNKGDICDNGHCVPGPTTPGGLGSTCTQNSDCASNECGNDGQGHEFCVESCNPMSSTCPGGFSCVSTAGTGGVCWPGADNGGGGCDSSSSGNGAFAMIGLLGFALVFTRRRR
ncbi:MAG: Ig-like domain-containing protein [Acidobacteriota bacterium]